MNPPPNPCYSETASSNCPATIYATPKLGRIAIPTHLINSVFCPHNALLIVNYPGVTVKMSGRNLGYLMEGLSRHRLQAVTAIEEATYNFGKAEVFVSSIEVVVTK